MMLQRYFFSQTKRIRTLSVLFCCIMCVFFLSSCSIKKMAMNSVAGMLAPDAESGDGQSGAITAFTSENDPELVGDAFPVILKLTEMMMLENPENDGLAVTAGQLYVIYANVFVQAPAEMLPPPMVREQNAAYDRACNFFRRGSGYALRGLDLRYEGFSGQVFAGGAESREAAFAQTEKADAAALFWAASGALANFALNPLDAAALEMLEGSVAMMERAAELDATYFGGLIPETLFNFYSAAPEFMGGSMEKAEAAFAQAVAVNGGSASLFTTYAKNICIPAQDGEGFDEAIGKALAIRPDDNPSNRLMTVVAQRRAAWLKANRSAFFLE